MAWLVRLARVESLLSWGIALPFSHFPGVLFMSDATSADSSNVGTITSLSELPKGGYPLDLEEVFKIPFETKSKMVVWSVLPKGSEVMSGKKPVWVLASDGYEKDIQFYSHRRQIDRAGYRIEKIMRSDKIILQAAMESMLPGEDDGTGERNAITEYYEEMVAHALREKVSDIHIERRKSSAVIRMRKHGQMMMYRELPTRFCMDLCSVIYGVLAENKDVSFMPSEYQAAAVNSRIQSQEVKLRYQSLPVYPDGFDVVLRVLPIGDEDEGTPDISLLGYSHNQVQELMRIVSKPVGALIIAGTTGSGKSTTLKNLLMLVNESRGYRCKIYTIEDPPEYKIPRVSQIPVVRRRNEDYSKKSPFADPLTATMRGDPDILMIGEIRDGFTGDGLKKATQSGHQVLTTTHASSALGVIERLTDFGITPSVMGSPEFINGLIYQKLLPLLCQNCALSFNDKIASSSATQSDLDLAERLRRVANFNTDTIRMRNPEGCEKCKRMGVTSRTVCAEVIAPDFKMLKLFRQQASIEAKAYWRSLSDRDPNSDNMTGKTVLEHALLKMRRGLISPHDVEDVLGPVDGAVRALEEMDREAEEEAIRQGRSLGHLPTPGLAPAKRGWDKGYDG